MAASSSNVQIRANAAVCTDSSRIVGYTQVIAKRAPWIADYPQPGSSAVRKPASGRWASHFSPNALG